MDWRSVKFDWNRARAFLVTVEEGSLAAAARALGMTQPTLGRQVSALEEELGVALFERTSTGLELTPNGLNLIEHVREMGEAASRLSLTASGHANSIEGNVCITAPELTACYMLPPIIKKLRREQPGIQIEVIASNKESNLKRREADIAIRGFRPTQPDLIAKKICDFKIHLYAAKTYLAELGHPTTPEGLNSADFISFDNSGRAMAILNEQGFNLTSCNFPIQTESSNVQWELVKQGIAVGIMAEEIGEAEPLVERALTNFGPLTGELWLVAHRELRTNRRIRLVYDLITEEAARLSYSGEI